MEPIPDHACASGLEHTDQSGPQSGLTRRALLGVLAGLAAAGGAGVLLLKPRSPGAADSPREPFNLKSWPVRSVEITNFTFDPRSGTVTYRSYKE